MTYQAPIELLSAAESVFDGWYAESSRIDWEDFIDRVEIYAGIDMGSDMMSPAIQAIQRHIRVYRKLES